MNVKNAKYYDELLKKEYPELYGLRQQKIAKMIRNIVIYEIFFALFAYGAYDYIQRSIALTKETDIIWKALIVGAVALVVPPLLFKSTLELIVPTWVGNIVSIKYEMRYPQPTGVEYKGVNRSNPQEFMKIKVETEKGKKKTVAFRSHLNQALQKGDRIVKFRGFTYPTEVTEQEKLYVCIVCGKLAKKGEKECRACHRPIVDLHTAGQPKDVWAQFDYAEFN